MRIAVTHEQARVSVAWVSEGNDEMYEGSGEKKRKKERRKEKKKERKGRRKEERKEKPWRGRIKCEEGGIFKWASSLLRLEYVTSGISLSLSLLPSLCPWVFLRHFSQYENIVRVILKPARNVFLPRQREFFLPFYLCKNVINTNFMRCEIYYIYIYSIR